MINERMMELINSISKGNKRAFSNLVGVTPTVIENIVGTRKGRPGYELLEKIAFAIENINLDWLLTGRGSMLRSDADNKKSELPAVGCTPSATPISPTDESFIYKMYEKEKEEKEKLNAKMLQMAEELGSLKNQLSQCQPKPTKQKGRPAVLGSTETVPPVSIK